MTAIRIRRQAPGLWSATTAATTGVSDVFVQSFHAALSASTQKLRGSRRPAAMPIGMRSFASGSTFMGTTRWERQSSLIWACQLCGIHTPHPAGHLGAHRNAPGRTGAFGLTNCGHCDGFGTLRAGGACTVCLGTGRLLRAQPTPAPRRALPRR